MTALPYAWKDVRDRLQARILELLPALGIAERPIAGIVTPRNPTRQDRRPGSFVIWTEIKAAGAWRDYATGEKGDVFDLIEYLAGLHSKIDAYWWALDFLRLERGTIRKASEDEAERRRRERDPLATMAREETEAAEKAGALLKDWLGLAPIAGTVAEIYLRKARAIPLERIPHGVHALRFAPELEHFDQATGEITTWPAIVTAVSRRHAFIGVHRTWLKPDGSGKAPVTRSRKFAGKVRGGAMRITRGPTGLNPGAAYKSRQLGPLAIGEGIETCLTVAAARPDYRVWAAGSLAAMGSIDWPDCACAVVLLGENDTGAQAREAFERALHHWRAQAQGRPVEMVLSAVGSDFNDWARAA